MSTTYEYVGNTNGMLFPIHDACLDILDQLCQVRREMGSSSPQTNQQNQKEQPRSLAGFCKALPQQRQNNFREQRARERNYYYARSGGMEWPHDYYGARQYWADECNTEPGWEYLCADPSSMETPNLHFYLVSELPKSSSRPTQSWSKDRIADRLGWLFPEEADAMANNDLEDGDWEEGIQILRQKSDIISADAGGGDNGQRRLAPVPVGLKNRWSIWKILQNIPQSE